MKISQSSVKMARLALFVVYFWFGLLKVIGQSPASPLVNSLFSKTIGPILPFVSISTFLILFGIFEMIIGILFVIPGLEYAAVILFALHIITTAMPVFVVPEIWTHPFVPTIEGQYIIKNLALVACVMIIFDSIKYKQEQHG